MGLLYTTIASFPHQDAWFSLVTEQQLTICACSAQMVIVYDNLDTAQLYSEIVNFCPPKNEGASCQFVLPVHARVKNLSALGGQSPLTAWTLLRA